MEIELPDGTILDAPDDADPSVVAKAYLAKQKQPADTRPVGDAGDAIMDPLRVLGSSAIATPVAGLAGLGTAATNAIGLTDTPAADVVERVQGALTYQPRTQAGQASTDAIMYPLEKLAQGADWLGQKGADATGSPAVGAAINTAVNFAPSLLLKGRVGKVQHNVSRPVPVGRPAAAGAAPKSAPAPALTQRAAGLEEVSSPNPARAAIDAGYRLKPSETGAKAGSVVEGLTGSAKLETSLVKKNQANSDRLIREEFGLQKGPIKPSDIASLRKPHNAVYSEVGRLGRVGVDDSFRADVVKVGRTPGESFKKDTNKSVEDLKAAYADEKNFVASDAVLKVRELRYKSSKNIGSRDPAAQELGYAQRAIADAIDSQLERHATSLGKTKLVDRYKKARVELAKIHSLQTATRNGEVSAPVLAKMLERGVPLSGNLKTIAETARDYPNVMRLGSKVKGGTPVNMAETAVALGGSMVNPAFLAAMAVRPATRAVLSSRRYQNSLAKQPRATNALAEPERARTKVPLDY